jgi:hypothetical protein
MDEPQVRERAESLCAALVAGDVDGVTADFSEELRRNLGEVLALFVLPSDAASVGSVERDGGTSAFTVRLELVGAGDEVVVETRWKERDGHPTLIEASHLSRVATADPDTQDDESGPDRGESADGTA